MTSKGLLPADDAAAVDFWTWGMLIGPAAAFVLPLLVAWLLGGFKNCVWINQPATFLQSFAILGAMCFPCGAFLVARGRRNLAFAGLSRTWPTVAGLVQSSAIERRQTVYFPMYKLVLNYGYQVADRVYQNDLVQFGPRWVKAKDLIEDLAKKYPAGATATVHYDPDDPETSVLETSFEMAAQNSWQLWCYFGAPFVISIVIALKNAGP
jgi:hypothetical protein